MAANTDTFRESAPLFSTTLNGAISSASTSIVLQSIASLPTGTGISLVIDPVTPTQTNAALQETVVGVISSGTVSLINALRGVEGTAQSHVSGANVYAYLTGADWNALMTGILEDHAQGGYHKLLHDANGNSWLDQNAVASAVNNWIAGNNATGSGPTLNVEGTDTNIDGNMSAKGTGKMYIDGAAPQAFIAGGFGNFVESGCVIAPTSGLNYTISAGVVWVNGKRYNVPAQTATGVTASKDTYVDVLVGANQNSSSQSYVITAASNNSTSPALAANSIRIGRIISGASAITYSDQHTVDTLGNFICPMAPGTSRTFQLASNVTWRIIELGNIRKYKVSEASTPGSQAASASFSLGTINTPFNTSMNAAQAGVATGWEGGYLDQTAVSFGAIGSTGAGGSFAGALQPYGRNLYTGGSLTFGTITVWFEFTFIAGVTAY